MKLKNRRLVFLLCAVFLAASGAQADTFATGDFALYVNHNSVFRSRFDAGLTWDKKESQFSNGIFEYDLDIGLMPFFRRYLFKDPNAEKSKRLVWRLGYLYLPNIATGAANDEHRGLTDLTVRFPLGNVWLLTDRNRYELRNIGGSGSSRYRNRLRMERNVKWGGFKATPYANTEFFYDGKVDRWSQTEFTAGAEFPWHFSLIMELYYTYSYAHYSSNNETYGLTLQRHL